MDVISKQNEAMDHEIAARLSWVLMYRETGNAGLVCARCGISRPTLRKWLRRYEQGGEDALRSQSRRPLNSPNRKVSEADRASILRLRAEHKGARRIQKELRLHEQRKLSLTTIRKILSEAGVEPLVRPRCPAQPKRYGRLVPGERVQMGTMKIAPGVYQYTALDECSRFRVLAVYSRPNAGNTLRFLDRVIGEMPFPIQRIQTGHGEAFFTEVVQRRLTRERIEFGPVPHGSPNLNGKLERSQLTDLHEFWARHAPTGDAIGKEIEQWQFDGNWRRPHGSLGGKTPIGRIAALSDIMPLVDAAKNAYDPLKKRALKERLHRHEGPVEKALGRPSLHVSEPVPASTEVVPARTGKNLALTK